jgi:multicomponent Na+:H+ antiporter subunit G
MTAFSTVLTLTGALLIALAGVGLLRLPDVYTRLNAAAKAGGLGIVLVLLGDLVTAPGWGTAVKVVVAIALQLITVPVGSFALGRAAYRAGTPLWEGTRYDELARVPDSDADVPGHVSGSEPPPGEPRPAAG